mmetsp:Transcript_10215/g.16616  ORF Transcript_10215/g.16616 Transcript_10215/m.16616 type:complete len:242 (+) Transcript_10215:89-814(+)
MARTRLLRPQDDDEDSLFTHSLVRDNLSHISEGSNEAGSLASSAYHSAVSGSRRTPSTMNDRQFMTAAGVMRFAPRPPSGVLATGDTRALEISAPTMPLTGAFGNSKDVLTTDADALRRTVKAFVESGVRGRRLEALRRDGQVQPVTFRLSRQVDSFEIAPESGKASHTVRLTEVASIYSGDDARVDFDLGIPGLDGQCAVVDLRDGRCLTFRFPGGEAKTFVSCMQIFVNEVQREASSTR